MLTLASNERIPLNPSMRLMLEIGHLREANPSTVSRAGILFVNPADLGWNPWVVLLELSLRMYMHLHSYVAVVKWRTELMYMMKNKKNVRIRWPPNLTYLSISQTNLFSTYFPSYTHHFVHSYIPLILFKICACFLVCTLPGRSSCYKYLQNGRGSLWRQFEEVVRLAEGDKKKNS